MIDTLNSSFSFKNILWFLLGLSTTKPARYHRDGELPLILVNNVLLECPSLHDFLDPISRSHLFEVLTAFVNCYNILKLVPFDWSRYKKIAEGINFETRVNAQRKLEDMLHVWV